MTSEGAHKPLTSERLTTERLVVRHYSDGFTRSGDPAEIYRLDREAQAG